MSSGPGTDKLRANFMAGGCRNCFSSSGTPAVQHSQMEKKQIDEIGIFRWYRWYGVRVREAKDFGRIRVESKWSQKKGKLRIL